MPETLPWLLTYTLAPVAAIVFGGCAAVARPQGRQLISAFDHFAAGVVFSAVAIELLSRLYEVDRPLPMVVGFIAGVLAPAGEQAMVRSGRDACADGRGPVHRQAPDRDRAGNRDVWRRGAAGRPDHRGARARPREHPRC
jgi:hypothetical protein